MIILERVYLMSIWLNRFNFYTLRFALILPVIGLTACNVTTSHIPAEGIGFREARFAEVSALRTYRSCRDDALNLDKMARLETSPARYLASAKLFEKCEANLGQEAKSLAKDERMKAYALAVQNYFKAGNIVKYYKPVIDMKKKLFPNKMVNMIIVGATFILYGAVDTNVISSFMHLCIYFLGVLHYAWLIFLQHRCFITNTELVILIHGLANDN